MDKDTKTDYIETLEQDSKQPPAAPVVRVPRLSTWLYVQKTGILYRPDGSRCSQCYSGRGDGMNNPAMQNVKNEGPIPCGLYTFGEVNDEKGPLTIRLVPHEYNQMFGRSGFLMHGDNHLTNHTASEGCIIADNATRALVAAAKGQTLRVIDRPSPLDAPAKAA